MSIFFIYTRKEIRRNDVKIAKNCLSADELKKSS